MKPHAAKKGKPRKLKLPRNTTAQRIETQADSATALHLAIYGRDLIEAEKLTNHLLYCYQGFRKLEAKGFADTHPSQRTQAEYVRRLGQALADVLLSAVLSRDGGTLRRVADLAEAWTGKAELAFPKRAGILTLKQIVAGRGDKLTLQRLAGLLNRKLAGDEPTPPQTDDGHAALRRLAKKLKFPLARGKVGRPRK